MFSLVNTPMFEQEAPMDESNEGALHGGLNPGRSCTLSCLDDVGADVRLRARFEIGRAHV